MDGNKLNNHYTNLKWCSPMENTSHKYKHETVGIGLTCSKVKEIVRMIENGKESIDIAKKYDVSVAAINNIKKGKTWSVITMRGINEN